MIYIHLIGHNYEYGIRELTRVFFPKEEIIILDDLNKYDDGILIISKFHNSKTNLHSITNIYKDHILIYEDLLNIEDFDIGISDLEKRIRHGIIQGVYDGLNTISSVQVSWGILTGIRPLKIVHSLIDNGFVEDSIIDILTDAYRLYNKKADLLVKIAKKQRKHIYPLDKNRFSLYIAIPFCPSRCLYCSFPSCSVERFGHFIDLYTEKLIYEIDRMGEIMRDKTISTVYLGGGTPTAIPIDKLEKIIQAIYRNFQKEKIKEITVEAGRPDTINADLLYMLKENRIDRISINPQTMNDDTLQLIGRNHTSSDIKNIYHLAKTIGFSAINMDLIVGLPSEDIDKIRTTLENIRELDPENLTVHTLAVKKGSQFKKVMDEYELESQKNIEEMLRQTKEFANEMGLEPYYLYRQKQMVGNFENIGYAKKGKECIYNIKMMEEKETIIGVGMGAVSKIFTPEIDRIERVPNVKSLNEYINRIDEMVERKRKFFS